MKCTIILTTALIAITVAAPVDTKDKNPGSVRTKKSPPPYGAQVLPSPIGVPSGYGSPCASAPALPVSFYLNPQVAPSLHYRSDNEESAIESHMNEEFDHAHSRGAYGGYDVAAPAVYGSVISVFPKANAGGCAVPLLLSCSPRIIAGQLLKSQSSGYAAPAPATLTSAPLAHAPLNYRADDTHHEPNMEMKHVALEHHHNAEKSSTWSEKERAMEAAHASSMKEAHPELHFAHQQMDFHGHPELSPNF